MEFCHSVFKAYRDLARHIARGYSDIALHAN